MFAKLTGSKLIYFRENNAFKLMINVTMYKLVLFPNFNEKHANFIFNF